MSFLASYRRARLGLPPRTRAEAFGRALGWATAHGAWVAVGWALAELFRP